MGQFEPVARDLRRPLTLAPSTGSLSCMDVEEKKRVFKWLRDHKRHECEPCHNGYDIGDPCALVGITNGKPDAASAKFTRVVPLTCPTCGDVRFLSVQVFPVAT